MPPDVNEELKALRRENAELRRANAILTFRVPGTGTRAVVRGFGAVYTGIDLRENYGEPVRP